MVDSGYGLAVDDDWHGWFLFMIKAGCRVSKRDNRPSNG